MVGEVFIVSGSHVPQQCRSCGGFCGGGYGNRPCRAIVTAPSRTLKADHVCAYTWIYSPPSYRNSLCALACLPEEQSILDWYELGETARVALRQVIADIIEANASRQRVEWGERARLAAA